MACNPTQAIAWLVGRVYRADMTDDPIRQAAISRRDAAMAEAQRWDQFIRMLDEVTQPVGALTQAVMVAAQSPSRLEPSRGHVFVHSHVRPAADAGKQYGENRGKMFETEDAAVAIIRAAGRPVPTREMLELLAARGIAVGGQDEASTLSARLSRSPRLVNVRPYGWNVRESALQTNEAADPSASGGESAASVSSTPHNAVERGEVAHDNIA